MSYIYTIYSAVNTQFGLVCSCDSYGNRPVTVAAASNLRARPATFGSGRIRSGSMGNRPQVVSGRQHRTSTSSTGSNSDAYYSNFNRALDARNNASESTSGAAASVASHFSIRKPNAAQLHKDFNKGKESSNKENHKQTTTSATASVNNNASSVQKAVTASSSAVPLNTNATTVEKSQ